MRFWRIRKIDPNQSAFSRVEADGHAYFLKHKMSHGTGVIYLSEESAQRSLAQVNKSYNGRPPEYELVAFEAKEIE